MSAPMQPWAPDTTPHQKRRVGKTIEELGELLAVLGRLDIQAIDAIDPSSGKTNRQRMTGEIGDVLAQIRLDIPSFGLDPAAIDSRMNEKTRQMHEWEAHFGSEV